MAPLKKMTKADIESRCKDKSYISLKKENIIAIVEQLTAEQQAQCFGGEKVVKPIDKFQAAGLLVQIPNIDKIDNRPISKIPLKKQLEIIRDESNKDGDFKKLLETEGLWSRAQHVEEHKEPGDFSPTKFWEVLNTLVEKIDLLK